MNILIIGNGFDLAHNLPTTYKDFLKFIDAFNRFKDICKEESVKKVWEDATEEDKKYILDMANLYGKQRTIFEEIEKLISNNVWMNYFWKLYTERKTLGMDGWIDFECEISRIIQTLDQARMTILADIRQGKKTGKMTQYQLNILSPLWGKAGIDRELISFEEKAITYRKTQFLKDLNRLTRCLEIYLGEFVEEIKPQVKLPDIEGLDINCVLSFNYTHTYENFYHTDKSKDVKYDYIHGEVKKDSTIETCNLILGIDEYLEGEEKNKSNEFIQFKKFYQRIYKKTGCKYVDWIRKNEEWLKRYSKVKNPENNIYIWGHSLDITDGDILSSLINMPNTKTTIFYHNQEALGNQIGNLVKVLGENELISMVHGENARIVFKEQQKEESVDANKN